MKHCSYPTLVLAILVVFPWPVLSQTAASATATKPEAAADEALKPELLVDQWFIRLNALGQWFISVDGREETAPVVDRFLELYSPDAFHQVQPAENQIGPTVLHGQEALRKWATDFARSYVQLGYRVDFMTRAEKSAQLFYGVNPKWGGVAAAVELSAVYTNRKDRRRFMTPGAAFFVFDAAGKIQRVRLYMLKDETVEIEP